MEDGNEQVTGVTEKQGHDLNVLSGGYGSLLNE